MLVMGPGCGLWIMGYCGDRGYWAVNRICTIASDWVSDSSSGRSFPPIEYYCICLRTEAFLSGWVFPTLIRVVIQSCYFMISVTKILYSCGSLPSSATPECATGWIEADLLLTLGCDHTGPKSVYIP